MLSFDSAPAIPANYPRLSALSPAEIMEARAESYIADDENPAWPVKRPGKDFSYQPLPTDNLMDWRTRIYIVWFCYLYENFAVLHSPMGAIEELILEFKAPHILDLPGRRLATLYAGAGADDPPSHEQQRQELQALRPHYELGLKLLVVAVSE